MTKDNEFDPPKIMPSQFMRELRPEYYSDTEDRAEHLLDAPTFEFHLDSITRRNQTQDFEIFCRKLCERTICPNLRAHTGPDGGGDSKVDTETYPVTEETAALFYIGEQKSASARWAFAFSAKEDWKTKVRDDVKKIAGTQRGYARIIFVTSRFAKDKDRADIEDELSKAYSIPVTIHDGSWIVKEIIENNRTDIAFNYLKIGEAKNDPLRLGPTDYSRAQQLKDIEHSIEDAEAFEGMERQRVTEALIAAKLSRGLELPRTETDGRFLRAIRLAKADGSYRQKLEAAYEHIWTSFWWFDDFQFLQDAYEAFETEALKSNNAVDLEFLCNLLQLFFNSVIHKHLSTEECLLDERVQRLKSALEKVAANKDRPNNSLEAQTSYLIIRMNEAKMSGKQDELTKIWEEFAAILEKATGLGEFNADRLLQMIDVAGQIAGDNPAYNELIEKTAEFVSTRKSEAEGALILLKRARKLDFSRNFEMIRLLGKAAINLTKREYSEDLIETCMLLSLAYRSAGMLWASRATCIFLIGSLVIKGEEENELPVSFVPTMKMFAWLSLELRHIPDFLFSIQMLNGSLATLPLTDESKAKVSEDIAELDRALGAAFLNLDINELKKLADFPDILEALGLYMARSALLYIMGHAEILRQDGSLPTSETDEDIQQIFSMLASISIDQSSSQLFLNAETPQTLSKKILGMTVNINITGSQQSILIAEVVLGALEAFFATAIEMNVMPHTEKLSINLIEDSEILSPSFEISEMDMTGIIIWPTRMPIENLEHQRDVLTFLQECSGKILAFTCITKDIETLLEKLFVDEAVQGRMTMIEVSLSSFHRVTSEYLLQMPEWQDKVKRTYEPKDIRPTLSKVDLKKDKTIESKEEETDKTFPKPTDHRTLDVRSVIDIHAWNKARWRGATYLQFDPSKPPCIVFLFENEEGARNIFQRWRERFGHFDENDEIYLAIVRELPQQSKYHYTIMVTSKQPDSDDAKKGKIFSIASRCLTVTPSTGENLENFLKIHGRFSAFYLLPAFLKKDGEPEIINGLMILKKNLVVKLAKDVGKNDIEIMALGPREHDKE